MKGDHASPQHAHIWQRNYYEHIIRNENEHDRIHVYIESNPMNWVEDDEFPGNAKTSTTTQNNPIKQPHPFALPLDSAFPSNFVSCKN